MSFFEIAHREFPHFGVSENVIRSEMNKRGYARRVAQPKPPRDPENKEKRLQFARNHLGWTVDDSMNILLMNETWVTDDRHLRCWVTRKVST